MENGRFLPLWTRFRGDIIILESMVVSLPQDRCCYIVLPSARLLWFRSGLFPLLFCAKYVCTKNGWTACLTAGVQPAPGSAQDEMSAVILFARDRPPSMGGRQLVGYRDVESLFYLFVCFRFRVLGGRISVGGGGLCCWMGSSGVAWQ